VAKTQIDPQALIEAVAVGNVPTLLMVLVQLTGDESWLREPYTLARTRGMEDNDSGGLAPELQTRVREAATEALLRWNAGEPITNPDPCPALLVRMLSASMGERVPDEYGPMLAAEMRAALGHGVVAEPLTPASGFRVAIIGAGITGIAAAARLKAVDVPFTVYERSSKVAGVWRDNHYPGAGVDTPSHLYSYAFAPHDWPHYFASRDQVVEYLEQVCDRFALHDDIRLNHEVLRVRYVSERRLWKLELRGADGSVAVTEANVVITAVGAFGVPTLPQLDGLDSFAGPLFHSACWPDQVSLAGKDVAVIGNGASAMQIVPAIADQVRHMTVFQRSPQWVQPFDKLRKPVPSSLRLLLKAVPLYRIWYRLRLLWIFHDKLYAALQRDPDWPDSERSINKDNDRHRKFLTNYITSELEGRPDLIDALVPSYPPFGKRMLMDNGWYAALRRDNVALVSRPVAQVIPDGLVTDDGQTWMADVIIAATGFNVVRFLASVNVIGVGGRDLRDVWDGDNCAAYLGTAVPGFPNLFMLYGPNTQPGHGGSLIGTIEEQLDYLIDVLSQMIQADIEAVECRQQVYDDYVHHVDEAHARMVWTHPGMSTYYRNSRGRVVVNSPFRNIDFWNMTRHADIDSVFVCQPAAIERSGRV
jgi:4-hydroxyacetophenone monooxygenase